MRTLAVAILAPLLLAAAERLPHLGPNLTRPSGGFRPSEFSTVAVIPDGRVLDADGLPKRSGPKPLDATGLA
jgi:hypothetical protein